MSMARSASDAWNEEYRRGRYVADPPVAFVEDILLAATAEGITAGLYVGCGNGRNLLPLVDGGIDVLGLDVSDEAIHQLARRRPDRADRLRHGDLESLPAGQAWPLVMGVYSSEARAESRIARARKLPGFREEPDCFYIGRHTVDQDEWNEGFGSIPYDDRVG
ncbi:class I SAM-dependent methyltransferase [Micromonospora yasonensis]|uniref:class I SAM-dependent methyltransferase n=1 Tax=Micromonospora yasonensis TaxID=1128667 RepID=UPI00222E5ADB|nr:class I SAM-dependent methyltransferase [Micromonospora yasonensis]MCW3838638.1 class I SAM-dependent methyltransferase [Micromonospora yasonensis]